jgi:hypothetical protein
MNCYKRLVNFITIKSSQYETHRKMTGRCKIGKTAKRIIFLKRTKNSKKKKVKIDKVR